MAVDWSQIGAVLAAAGSLATAFSLVYLALQTREAHRQSDLANQLAMLRAHDRLTDLTVQIDALFVEHPHLRKYFYSGDEFKELVGDELHQVLAMAVLISDFMENGLQHETFNSKKVDGEWMDYCYAMMRDSPAIRSYLNENRNWYSPGIGEMLRKVESSFHHAELISEGGFEVSLLAGVESPEPLRAQLERLYESSFPPEERDDPERIFDTSPDRAVLVLRDPHDHSALAFASVLHVGDGVALLEYLAVSPNSRNSGVGGFLLDYLFGYLLDENCRVLFMELEKPRSMGASHQAARRIRFYKRHGCVPVEWVPEYWIPSFRIPGQRIPMLLFARQLDGGVLSPDPEAFHAVYGRAYPNVGPEDTPLVAESPALAR